MDLLVRRKDAVVVMIGAWVHDVGASKRSAAETSF